MKKIMLMATLLLSLNASMKADNVSTDTDIYDKQLLQPGDTAANFTIVDDKHPDGLSLNSLKGKYVVLDFWASWCPDCRKDTKTMVELYHKHASDSIVFIGISFDTNKERWLKYVSDNGMVWTQYSELKKWKKETTIDRPYKVNWIPTTYLIGKDGHVMLGTVDIEKLKAALQGLEQNK